MADDPKLRISSDNLTSLAQDLMHLLGLRLVDLRKGTRYEQVRRSDVRVFALAARHPRSVSEIARDLAVSRQAVHSSFKRLEALKILEMIPHPTSGRDKLMAVTERGQHASLTAIDQIAILDAECASIIGRKRLEQMRESLVELVAGLKARAP